ncbi:MAG: agmatine deiminase family protein [Limisphaerales bacterium]
MPQPEIARNATPAQLGFYFPAEWERHEATWLGWPHNASDWPGKFETIPWVYGEMVRKISAGEKIYLLVRNKTDENFARHIFKRAGVDLQKIKFVTHPTNRGWTRDTGPIFVKSQIANRKSQIH